MNAVSKKSHLGMAQRIKILVAILFGSPWFFALACRSEVLSKPPILSEFDPQGVVVRYMQEFNQMGEKEGYWTPVALSHTPDAPWQAYIEESDPSLVSTDFFRLRLRKNTSGESRLLFTFWSADIGSGVRARVRWSKDGNALQIKGDTRGFSYEPRPDADSPKYESFNFIYLVDKDKMYSVPRGAV